MNSLRCSERNCALCLYSITFLVNRSKSGWPASLNPGKARRWMLATPECIKGRAVSCPRLIYSIGDLYSVYDQFQLAQNSRDITTMRTPLGLLRMCTLPMGATNSVAPMQNAMNTIFEPFIPEKTRPFLDDMPIKGCLEEFKNETLREDGLRQFVWEHMQDVEAILKKLIEVGLTLSGEKSAFGLQEVKVVGQMCGPYGRMPSKEKVEAINQMKDCQSASEVRRFLGGCIFYRIWIPHFAHISNPLYSLLRKNMR